MELVTDVVHLTIFLEIVQNKEIELAPKPSNPISKGRPPRHPGNVSGSQGTTRDITVKSEARAPARRYAIRAREDAFALDVITGTFSLLDIDITVLIDPSSTHLYIYTNLFEHKMKKRLIFRTFTSTCKISLHQVTS